MSGQSLARAVDLRSVPAAVWAVLALAVLYFVYLLDSATITYAGALAAAAPLVFAAAVLYAAPADRRFVYGALCVAAHGLLIFGAAAIPDAWLVVSPPEWIGAVPLLQDLGSLAVQLGSLLLLIGLALLGVALGGVRTRIGVTIVALGLLVAVSGVAWIVTHPVEGLGGLELARSLILSTLWSLAWAFVLASAVDARRRLLMIGTGILAGLFLFDSTIGLWGLPAFGPGTDFGLIQNPYGALAALGWLTMAVGALVGELSGRSRAQDAT